MNSHGGDSCGPVGQPVRDEPPVAFANVHYKYLEKNMNMQPIKNGAVFVETDGVGHCQHPAKMLKCEYDRCMLAWIILTSIMWFPFGLYALLALSSAKNYRCNICGFTQTGGDWICLYATFGMLIVTALAVYASATYIIVIPVPPTAMMRSLVNPTNWEVTHSTATVN